MVDDLVTVLVPARNEERSIVACLRSVLGQDHRDLQVVVVDGDSTDRTAALVQALRDEDPRVELVCNPRHNIPSSLNLGLSRARGRWLVRVDAHSTVPPDYVSVAVRRLHEGRWGGVGGRKDAVGRTPAGRAIALVLSSRLGVGNSTYHHGTSTRTVEHLAFGAYPTALLREVGGWDESLEANEDFEMDHRLQQAGYPLLFDPAMAIAWECRQSIADLWRQYLRYGRGKADVALLHPESLRPRHVAPPLFVLYVAAAVGLGPIRPARSVAMLAPYALVVALESLRCARALEGTHERLAVPPAFAAMHLAWGTGFWLGLVDRLGGRRRGRSGVSAPSGD
jgi:succinoglycan biosynthesis protein ExoA